MGSLWMLLVGGSAVSVIFVIYEMIKKNEQKRIEIEEMGEDEYRRSRELKNKRRRRGL